MARELHLLAFGNNRSAGPWRYPAVDNTTAGVRRTLVERARTAEAGTFDALFFADGLNYGPPATWAYKTTEDFEPLTTAAALSAVTEQVGFVVTGSAALAHPYHLARQLLSLDHLSGGRAGWNLVTSFARAAAENFSADGVVDHDERYRIAGEAIEVVRKLWDSWGEDAIVEEGVPVSHRQRLGRERGGFARADRRLHRGLVRRRGRGRIRPGRLRHSRSVRTLRRAGGAAAAQAWAVPPRDPRRHPPQSSRAGGS